MAYYKDCVINRRKIKRKRHLRGRKKVKLRIKLCDDKILKSKLWNNVKKLKIIRKQEILEDNLK